MPNISESIKIAVTSGKGGVGKTIITMNLAMLYARQNKKVLILDGDLGLSNIDVAFGLAPRYNLKHVIEGKKSLKEIIVTGPLGIMVMPAGSGAKEMTNLTTTQQLNLLADFQGLDTEVDIFLIDTGAGISNNVFYLCNMARDVVIVATPEPTSISDAYVMMKVLTRDFRRTNLKVVVNNARSAKEAQETFKRLYLVADKFLNISIDYPGYLPYEQKITDSIKNQRVYIDMYPKSSFSKKLSEIGNALMENPSPAGGGLFW
jgi:flagellar biosynthesis protein FlhG